MDVPIWTIPTENNFGNGKVKTRLPGLSRTSLWGDVITSEKTSTVCCLTISKPLARGYDQWLLLPRVAHFCK